MIMAHHLDAQADPTLVDAILILLTLLALDQLNRHAFLALKTMTIPVEVDVFTIPEMKTSEFQMAKLLSGRILT
jgi:hypothetical protein